MSQLIIKGGRKIGGRYTAPGNKNAALPMLAAALLTEEPVTLDNLPLIDDVRTMLDILRDLGAEVTLTGHKVVIRAKGIRKYKINAELCKKVRSSILFAGPMAARLGQAILFPPGGDVIGRRPLDTHFYALTELGIKVCGNGHLRFTRGKLEGKRILLDEASVTATENAVMAATLAKGRTEIYNAACEPHVQDLCMMLNAMGARISGIGTNCIRIAGVEKLHGVKHRIAPDYISIASFITAAALTGGKLTVDGVQESDMIIAERAFRKLGISWHIKGTSLVLPNKQSLKIKNDFGSAIPKIEDGIWPAFPSDLMSVAIVAATQAQGTMLFFEKLFESRMYFVDRLIEMGGRIVQCDPHRVIVSGPARLNGTHLSSPDIRAGMALVIAALCAKGTSVIDNAHIIDRGYERIDEVLKALGADVERRSAK